MMNQNRLLAIAASLLMVFVLSACQATKKTGITTEQNVVDEFADEVQIVDAGPADGSSSADEAARIQKELEEREAAKRAKAEEEARRAAEEEAKRIAEQEAKRIAQEKALTVEDDAATRGVVNDAVPAGVPAYSVYFDFDKSSILPRFEEAVLAHADYLRVILNLGWKSRVIAMREEAGNTTYRLAIDELSQSRKALELLGIDGSRIDVTSYGSEKPRAMGHNENAWQENRRADFVY